MRHYLLGISYDFDCFALESREGSGPGGWMLDSRSGWATAFAAAGATMFTASGATAFTAGVGMTPSH